MMPKSLMCAGVLSLTVLAPAAAIEPFQVDTFEDGTEMGWQRGAPSPVDPVNVADGGPDGAGDAWLENEALGGTGPGSNWVMFNNAQWTGDYGAAGVTRLTAHLVNFGASTLPVRIAVEGLASRWSSTDAVMLPGDGAWHRAVFDLTPGAMTQVVGSATLEQVLASVAELRFLVAAAPAWGGASVAVTIGIDDLAAGDLVLAAGFENGLPGGWSAVVP